MDYFKYDPDRIMGLEVLRFDHVELLEKTNQRNTPLTSGTLYVLFLKDTSRFILCLNDWKYLLLKRLPVMNYVKKDTNILSYSLPTLDGLYILRFPYVEHSEAITNFEKILRHHSDFYRQNEPLPAMKHEPEEIQGPRQRFLTQQLGHGTAANLTSQNFEIERMRKRDKLKKKISDLAHKVANKFAKNHVRNDNLTEKKSYEDLINTKESQTVPHFLLKRDVEKAINFGHDVLKRLYQEADESLKQPGFIPTMEHIEDHVINGLNRPYYSHQNLPYDKKVSFI